MKKSGQEHNEILELDNIKALAPFVKDGNVIWQVGVYVEQMSIEEANVQMFQCSEVRGFCTYLYGGVLARIKSEHWYVEYGCTSFSQLVEERLGMSKSTAYDYINIYIGLLNSELAWTDVKHIGWTKFRLFAKCLTKENGTQWIKLAEENNASQLREIVKEEVKKAGKKAVTQSNPFLEGGNSTHVDASDSPMAEMDGGEITDSGTHVVESAPLVSPEVGLTSPNTRKFLLYPDQEAVVDEAICLALKDSETKFKGVALTNICMNFLATYTPGEPE